MKVTKGFKRFWALFIVAILLVGFPVDAFAKGGVVHVKGYTRKDGTYVAPHYRSSPDGNFYNNWSTAGNVNPYTGKEGTKVTPPANYGGSLPSSYTFPSSTYSTTYIPSSSYTPTYTTTSNTNTLTIQQLEQNTNRIVLNGANQSSTAVQPSQAVMFIQIPTQTLWESFKGLSDTDKKQFMINVVQNHKNDIGNALHCYTFVMYQNVVYAFADVNQYSTPLTTALLYNPNGVSLTQTQSK
ncbi:hypothetical protein PP175_26780 (plasmid) [Aneurinibacillus sp. Ricciae_BoGa-3]|uniref:hypothetical protein n=1 Tax=Aneurinibacillus sp. Ricciae_BoGa-3 TaxID=3022697 RepID=UPI00234219F2|nr:hypothetical protein [Aneurinibacillus sp. Ricciae_BoGa-3]WCK57644.1 hypothetical protein PP175_26780 [Aneurinibacillus sp. Ricciae_BoGa-3]